MQFFSIPRSVVIDILFCWTESGRDITSFDISLCHRNLRYRYLSILKSYKVGFNFPIPLQKKTQQWFSKRQIAMRWIRVEKVSQLRQIEVSSLRKLDITFNHELGDDVAELSDIIDDSNNVSISRLSIISKNDNIGAFSVDYMILLAKCFECLEDLSLYIRHPYRIPNLSQFQLLTSLVISSRARMVDFMNILECQTLRTVSLDFPCSYPMTSPSLPEFILASIVCLPELEYLKVGSWVKYDGKKKNNGLLRLSDASRYNERNHTYEAATILTHFLSSALPVQELDLYSVSIEPEDVRTVLLDLMAVKAVTKLSLSLFSRTPPNIFEEFMVRLPTGLKSLMLSLCTGEVLTVHSFVDFVNHSPAAASIRHLEYRSYPDEEHAMFVHAGLFSEFRVLETLILQSRGDAVDNIGILFEHPTLTKIVMGKTLQLPDDVMYDKALRFLRFRLLIKPPTEQASEQLVAVVARAGIDKVAFAECSAAAMYQMLKSIPAGSARELSCDTAPDFNIIAAILRLHPLQRLVFQQRSLVENRSKRLNSMLMEYPSVVYWEEPLLVVFDTAESCSYRVVGLKEFSLQEWYLPPGVRHLHLKDCYFKNPLSCRHEGAKKALVASPPVAPKRSTSSSREVALKSAKAAKEVKTSPGPASGLRRSPAEVALIPTNVPSEAENGRYAELYSLSLHGCFGSSAAFIELLHLTKYLKSLHVYDGEFALCDELLEAIVEILSETLEELIITGKNTRITKKTWARLVKSCRKLKKHQLSICK